MLGGVGMLFWLGQQQSSGSKAQAASGPAQPIEQAAPNFSLPSLDSGNVALSDYSGQVVLVNLWATWCPPCKAEMPTINAFYEAHKDEEFVVLAINSQEQAPTVDAFIQAEGFSFPVLLRCFRDLN